MWMIKTKMPSGVVYCVAEITKDGQRCFAFAPIGKNGQVLGASGWVDRKKAEQYLAELLQLNPQLANFPWEVTEAQLPQ